ncbi:MAG TPA: helix-turn-helix domain-containing protein [Ktedonosporobacter sp.]|nr:helix-turn-helix domain-containing protein [Ktedonosporobacter sp.]
MSDEDLQDLEYPPDLFLVTIRSEYIQIVDTVLLAALGRMWERMGDIAPHHRQDIHFWSSSPEELRSSRLGQALLTVADYAGGGFVGTAKVERAMKRVYRMVFGDSLTDGSTIPPNFHKTDLGKLFHAAYSRLYPRDNLLTPKQAYELAGVARQSVYDRLAKEKLTPVYLHGDLHFLRDEIEAWKLQREEQKQEKQRGRLRAPED